MRDFIHQMFNFNLIRAHRELIFIFIVSSFRHFRLKGIKYFNAFIFSGRNRRKMKEVLVMTRP